MREHEVPTHVQAEDRVLLWFTFPQVVAMTAVCALSYGVYRYAPVGPSEVRMALAVLFGLFGIAMVAGKIGGRRLPLVAADLLRYRLGPRRYVGPVSQLVRSEAPVPVQPVKNRPSPVEPDASSREAECPPVGGDDGIGASENPPEETERRQPPQRPYALPPPSLVSQRLPRTSGRWQRQQRFPKQEEPAQKIS